MAKTFLKNGKWVDNPNQPAVFSCECGGKYIKTRPRQKRCLHCMANGKLQEKNVKRQKFDFESMKARATHTNASVRKQVFIEYFEQFQEFPSYLFDNETNIAALLYKTMQDLLQDSDITKTIHDGARALLLRLPPPAGGCVTQ